MNTTILINVGALPALAQILQAARESGGEVPVLGASQAPAAGLAILHAGSTQHCGPKQTRLQAVRNRLEPDIKTVGPAAGEGAAPAEKVPTGLALQPAQQSLPEGGGEVVPAGIRQLGRGSGEITNLRRVDLQHHRMVQHDPFETHSCPKAVLG